MSDKNKGDGNNDSRKSIQSSDSVDFAERAREIKAASGFNLQNALNKPTGKDPVEKK